MQKSANKLWKESGTTLPFKEWIEREKQKFNYQGDSKSFDGISMPELSLSLPMERKTSNKSFLGLSSTTLIIAGILIAGAGGYYLYKKMKA